MIGLVVVSHGQLAVELVNAARTIVGEIPGVAAVSIGWSDDVSRGKEAIGRAIAEAGGGDVLVLTDMFGGTPTNLSLLFLSEHVEVVTGVNLPMLIKATSLREGGLGDAARALRDQGKGSIYVASELLEKKAP
jgi:PTS system mannose-specific IIA component